MRRFFLFLAGLLILFSCSPNVFSQKEFLNVFGKDDTSKIVKKANKKLAANDIGGAVKILDEAIEKEQDLFEVYKKRSFIRRFYLTDTDGAIADLNKVLEIKPDDFDSYIEIANLKRKHKKDFQGALKDYETARQYRPESVTVFIEIALIKSALKDFDGAISELATAIKTNPDSVELNVSMSDLLKSHNKLDQAITHLQNFLDNYAQKRNGVLPKLKGEKVKKNKTPANFGDGEKSDPVRRYSQMEFSVNSLEDLFKQQAEIESIRNLAETYITLGKMYISRNDSDKAFITLNTALEIDKNQEEAYGLRGILYLSRDEYEKAIVELSKAADIADEPYFYLNRGIAYLLTANNKKAQMDFDYFLKLYPEGKTVLAQRTAEARQKLQGNITQPK